MSPRARRVARRVFGLGLRARSREERGYVTILLAVLVSSGFLFAAMAVSIDVSRWYDEMNRIQKAADAAALAGVPYLPFDLPNATVRAKEVAARNGYDDASPDVVVTVEIGDLASQLKVTIKSTIRNAFGGFIGIQSTTLERTATADYKGPAPMGSPCNTFGNEPNAGGGSSSPTPTGTAQGSTPFANCSRNPTFWGVVEGPETGKVQGDRYSTRNCESTGVDGCSGTTNSEYGPKLSSTSTTAFGYVFVVKVQPAAVGQPITLQAYDPIMVNAGQSCQSLPTYTSFNNDSNNTNPWVINSDARNRYSKDGSSYTTYCTGDSYPGTGSGATTKHGMTTSFVLRQQVDSLDPTAAPVQNDTSGSPCIKQYGSYVTTSSLAAGLFQSSSGSYNADLARMFHNWVPLCTFTPTRSGDYYLQVRTNVALGGTGTGLERSGNTAAAALTGDTSTGEGSNSFALRAVTVANQQNNVSVSGYEHMPIYINADTATATFNLIRVLPGAAGQTIAFSYFDAGDASASGSVKVLPPTDATGSITSNPFPGSCKATGGSAGSGQTLTSCSATITLSGNTSMNNGKTETITIPIPTDYNCNVNSFGGCWYRVQIGFGTGSVHDVTTWDATIIGDPVRLVK